MANVYEMPGQQAFGNSSLIDRLSEQQINDPIVSLFLIHEQNKAKKQQNAMLALQEAINQGNANFATQEAMRDEERIRQGAMNAEANTLNAQTNAARLPISMEQLKLAQQNANSLNNYRQGQLSVNQQKLLDNRMINQQRLAQEQLKLKELTRYHDMMMKAGADKSELAVVKQALDNAKSSIALLATAADLGGQQTTVVEQESIVNEPLGKKETTTYREGMISNPVRDALVNMGLRGAGITMPPTSTSEQATNPLVGTTNGGQLLIKNKAGETIPVDPQDLEDFLNVMKGGN